MGLPNINITFETLASTVINRSEKGVLAMMVKDSTQAGGHVLTSASQMPEGLSAANQAEIQRAFLGYQDKQPKKVILYVMETTESDLTKPLAYFATQTFDYLVGPSDITSEQAQAVVTWVKEQRKNSIMVKAVLPDIKADCEAVVNFTTDSIQVGEQTYTTAQYCGRIAGLLCCVPLDQSCTYAVLPEVTDVSRLTKDAMDTAIDAGELILFHDGEKVKIGRGVTSLTTTTDTKGEVFKKIKVVELTDIIKTDIKKVAEDEYIGKYANSYDNKCLLIVAIGNYFREMERDNLLNSGTSTVGIDLEAQRDYLYSIGTDVSEMSEQEIKEANTREKVFLTASIQILDAIEDIDLNILI